VRGQPRIPQNSRQSPVARRSLTERARARAEDGGERGENADVDVEAGLGEDEDVDRGLDRGPDGTADGDLGRVDDLTGSARSARGRRRTMVKQAAMLTSSLTRADLQLSPNAAPALTPTLSAARSWATRDSATLTSASTLARTAASSWAEICRGQRERE